VARRLAAEGCFGFAVATVREGIELREAGISQPILVTAGIEPIGAPCTGFPDSTKGGVDARGEQQQGRSWVVALVAEHDLSVAIWDGTTVDAIARATRQFDLPPVKVHLKVDTGMGRLGVPSEQAPARIAMLNATHGIELEGIFSNLAAADHSASDAGHGHTALQVSRFAELCATLQAEGQLPPHRHLANTAALMFHPDSWEAEWCNGVMPGLALYGASLTPAREPLGLEPVLSWWTAVITVRDVPAGWPVGYGLKHITDRPSRIAVLPVGYHDGWPRALGGRAQVLVAGQRAPVVGAVSMDLTMVDVTELPATRVGDVVSLIGGWGDRGMGVFSREVLGCAETPSPSDSAIHENAQRITAEEVAVWADSIGHELLSRIGERVPRVYLDSTVNSAGILAAAPSTETDVAEPAQ
jgi:alanine racemase